MIFFVLVFAAPSGQAEDQLTGVIDHFTDGESFMMHGRIVSLRGIDVPEYYQNFLNASGQDYLCGKQAVNSF